MGGSLRYGSYSVNTLNQYTQRTVPGAVDVTGMANSNSTVTVNVQPTFRKDDYFWKEYSINNSTGAVYQPLTNVAVLQNGSNPDICSTNTGSIFLPKTPEIIEPHTPTIALVLPMAL